MYDMCHILTGVVYRGLNKTSSYYCCTSGCSWKNVCYEILYQERSEHRTVKVYSKLKIQSRLLVCRSSVIDKTENLFKKRN